MGDCATNNLNRLERRTAMNTYIVKVRGIDRGEIRAMTFIIEGRNDEDALGQACDLQRVRLLDQVFSVNATKA